MFSGARTLARDQQKWKPVLRPIARKFLLRMIFVGEPVPTSPDHARTALRRVKLQNGLIGK
jgi:hypothetical protein